MNERKHGTDGNSTTEFDDLITRNLTKSVKQGDAVVPSDGGTSFLRQGYRTRQIIFILTLAAVIMIYREDVLAMFINDHIKPDDINFENQIETDTEQMSGRGIFYLKSLLKEARKSSDALLQEQYGKYANQAFGKRALLEKIVSPSYVSIERLKRRIKIKIIQAALLPDFANDSIKFTWAVGGHSAAAGHGNLLNQSYAAVLERVTQPSFAALGVEFRGKNYAMGGTSSAPEVSMCLNEIFGIELDVLSWDYGMTDGRKYWYYQMFAQRAGVHPSKPSIFSFSEKNQKYQYPLESAGLATFNVDAKKIEAFPNSDDVDPTELPPGVKYLMCNGHAEKEDLCKAHKWKTSQSCDKVNFQSSWHSGWKVHQYVGYLLATYMLENLSDALNELDPYSAVTKREDESYANESRTSENEHTAEGITPSISQPYLNYLLSLEEEDKQTFRRSEVPTDYKFFLDNTNPELYNAFYRNHSMCHTALLPSQARYDGLVTESGVVSTYLHNGRTTYTDEGNDWNHLPEPSGGDASSPALLAFEPKSRDICKYTEIDFKDCFMVRKDDNWMSMLVPNNAEKEVFSSDLKHRSTLGLIMICTRYFSWSKYSKDYIFLHHLTNATSSAGSIVINSVKVTGSIDIDDHDHRCYIMEHEGGFYFQPSLSGQFDIKIRHEVDGGRVYISSVVIL